MAHRLTDQIISSHAALEELLGAPSDLVRSKISDRLHALTRPFIENAPFVCIATAAADGSCDLSPRGDGPGFVRILDDRTLLLPERPGNRLADSLRNLLSSPGIGMLFFIPGVGDTFRVNGKAMLTTDQTLLAPCAVENKIPKLGVLIDIQQAYLQCSKAFLRSDLWNPERYIARTALPTSGEIHRQLADGEFDADSYDAERASRYARREGFY
jgi:uncharacterized protein